MTQIHDEVQSYLRSLNMANIVLNLMKDRFQIENRLEQIKRTIGLSDDLRYYFTEIPSLKKYSLLSYGNELYMYGISDLLASQVGYRWDIQGKTLEEWEPNWIVVADIGADPFIADIAQQGTPISVAIHGIGTWQPISIAPDFGSFLQIFSAWIDIQLIQFENNIEEQTLWSELDQTILHNIGEPYRKNFLDYLST